MELRKRKHVLLVLGLGAIAFMAWLCFLRNTEPIYDGKRLSEWVDLHESGSPAEQHQAVVAIRTIGTNALPHLLAWISYETPRWRGKLGSLAERLPDWLTGGDTLNRLTCYSTAATRQHAAIEAFVVLGPIAEPLLPQLEQLIQATNLPMSSLSALVVASAIGPSAVPIVTNQLRRLPLPVTPLVLHLADNMGTNARALTSFIADELNHTNGAVAERAALSFVMVGPSNHFDADRLVPILVRRLQDPDYGVRELALFVLPSFGARAAPALPALTNALSDPDPGFRTNAAAAIAGITKYFESK